MFDPNYVAHGIHNALGAAIDSLRESGEQIRAQRAAAFDAAREDFNAQVEWVNALVPALTEAHEAAVAANTANANLHAKWQETQIRVHLRAKLGQANDRFIGRMTAFIDEHRERVEDATISLRTYRKAYHAIGEDFQGRAPKSACILFDEIAGQRYMDALTKKLEGQGWVNEGALPPRASEYFSKERHDRMKEELETPFEPVKLPVLPEYKKFSFDDDKDATKEFVRGAEHMRKFMAKAEPVYDQLRAILASQNLEAATLRAKLAALDVQDNSLHKQASADAGYIRYLAEEMHKVQDLEFATKVMGQKYEALYEMVVSDVKKLGEPEFSRFYDDTVRSNLMNSLSDEIRGEREEAPREALLERPMFRAAPMAAQANPMARPKSPGL